MSARPCVDMWDFAMADARLYMLVMDAFEVLDQAGKPRSVTGVLHVVANAGCAADTELLQAVQHCAAELLDRRLH